MRPCVYRYILTAMRPLPVIPGTVRAAVIGSLPGGRKWTNVIHARYQGGATQPTITEVTALDTQLYKFYVGAGLSGGSAWLSTCHNQVTVDKCVYYVLDGSAPVMQINHGGTGSGGTTTLPTETAFVLTLRTAKRGRRYRGRIYLPVPIPGTLAIGGYLAPGNVTSTLAQWDAVIALLGTANWKIGVATYGHSVLKDGTVSTWSPDFTECAPGTAGRSMDATADVQRHRKS